MSILSILSHNEHPRYQFFFHSLDSIAKHYYILTGKCCSLNNNKNNRNDMSYLNAIAVCYFAQKAHRCNPLWLDCKYTAHIMQCDLCLLAAYMHSYTELVPAQLLWCNAKCHRHHHLLLLWYIHIYTSFDANI